MQGLMDEQIGILPPIANIPPKKVQAPAALVKVPFKTCIYMINMTNKSRLKKKSLMKINLRNNV